MGPAGGNVQSPAADAQSVAAMARDDLEAGDAPEARDAVEVAGPPSRRQSRKRTHANRGSRYQVEGEEKLEPRMEVRD